MPSDPGSATRAAVLAGAIAIETPADLVAELRVPAVRRIMPRINPPLDLTVIPFRYQVDAAGIPAPVRPRCARRPHRR